MYMCVYEQEEKNERIYTELLTLVTFWRGRGRAEVGGGEKGQPCRKDKTVLPK